MEITENQELTQKFIKEQQPREGIHLTDLTGPCLRKTFLGKTQRLPQTAEDSLRMMLGRGHHEMLEEQPSEISLEADGIKATMDGLERDGEEMIPIEYKTTRASSESSPERFHWWIEQIMGYCWLWGAMKARLYVIHMMGNYRDRNPCVKAYDLSFSRQELQDNWKELLRRRDLLQSALESDSPPEGGPRQGMEWACRGCSGKNICAELRRNKIAKTEGKEG